VRVLGVVIGLVAGGLVLSDVPLLVKLLVGVAVVVVGVAGPFGSVLLAGCCSAPASSPSSLCSSRLNRPPLAPLWAWPRC
jgi:hypothetical protein